MEAIVKSGSPHSHNLSFSYDNLQITVSTGKEVDVFSHVNNTLICDRNFFLPVFDIGEYTYLTSIVFISSVLNA